MKKYITFTDLQFKPHKVAPNSVGAYMEFPNGQWISVVGGDKDSGLYGDGKHLFEILSSSSHKFVRAWRTKEEVTNHMRYLQKKTDKK